jgi:hypothetical protein
MKFLRKKYRTTVRIKPETIVPGMESSGFFIFSPRLLKK